MSRASRASTGSPAAEPSSSEDQLSQGFGARQDGQNEVAVNNEPSQTPGPRGCEQPCGPPSTGALAARGPQSRRRSVRWPTG